MSLRVDASIGIALAPDHGTTPESVLQKADVAMFAAKRAHAPWQIYSSEHDQNARDRLELMEDLRDAIRRGEIVLVLPADPRPVARAGSSGAEALARWQHPSRGILAPAAFLGLVADAGLMGPFTMDVLDQAFVQQARWSMRGIRPRRLGQHLGRQPARRRAARQDWCTHRHARRRSGPHHAGDHRGLLHRRPRAGTARPGAAARVSASNSRSTISAPGSRRSPTFAGCRSLS